MTGHSTHRRFMSFQSSGQESGDSQVAARHRSRSRTTSWPEIAGVARRLPKWAEVWAPKRILVAFDADPDGDRATVRLVSEDPRARRMRPPDGHEDWNAVLKARTAAFPSK